MSRPSAWKRRRRNVLNERSRNARRKKSVKKSKSAIDSVRRNNEWTP